MKKKIVNKRPGRKTGTTQPLTLRDLKSDEIASVTGGGGGVVGSRELIRPTGG